MSKFLKGILGGFSGLVGTVVGADYRGIDVMRSRPKKTSKLPVQSQIDQRFIFALIIGFLKPLAAFIKLAVTPKSKSLSPMNTAVQYNLANAITGLSPDFAIDFSKVQIANGILPLARFSTLAANAGGRITVTWDITDKDGLDELDRPIRLTDTLRLVTYCKNTNMYYTTGYTTKRSAGTFSARLPNGEEGDVVHVWLVFVAANNKTTSTSQYLGQVVILE
jgi:hypothetical protein